jgi:TusA-related sulfurtransferase
MESGQTLQVVLDPGEPVANVPRSARDEGHQILSVSEREDGLYNVLLRKSGA